MHYLIGTDEAGYGPNLGPLVISATVWQVPEETGSEELAARLGDVIAATPREADQCRESRVAMADSKVLYRPGGGMRHLERGLWAAWALLDRRPQGWSDVWDALSPGSTDDMRAVPWYAGYDVALPLDADRTRLGRLAPVVQQAAAKADVRLIALRSKTVFPAEFNREVERLDSKGAALSQWTLALAAQLIESLPENGSSRSISVVCDKHGGRNRYAHLLAEHFPEALIEIHGESRRQSVYRFGPPERRVQFRFQSKAESHLPAALASMASKYLRELAMKALNHFWCARVDDLRPTAGYPQDAKRFKAAIADVQEELQIEDRLLWRAR